MPLGCQIDKLLSRTIQVIPRKITSKSLNRKYGRCYFGCFTNILKFSYDYSTLEFKLTHMNYVWVLKHDTIKNLLDIMKKVFGFVMSYIQTNVELNIRSIIVNLLLKFL